jgi:hypothetical protein
MFCAYVLSIKITKFKNMNTFRKQWFGLFFCVSSMKLKIILKNTYNTEYRTVLTTILPILFLYLNTVIVTAEAFEP